MSAVRVRTGIARCGDRWHVVVAVGGVAIPADPGYETEAEAEAMAESLTAAVRSTFT